MGRKSVSYFELLGLESESFSLFPHSFEWVSQKPHLSSTNVPGLNFSVDVVSEIQRSQFLCFFSNIAATPRDR